MDPASPSDNDRMTTVLQRVVDGEIAALPASMLAGGLTREAFARWGIDFTPEGVTIDALGVSLERGGGQRLRSAIDAAAADPDFFGGFLEAAEAAATQLAKLARAAAASGSASEDELARWIADLAAGGRSLAPAMVAAPLVRDRLQELVAGRISGDSGNGDDAAQRLAWAGRPPAAVEAIHDCYRIAREMSNNPEAAEAVRELSGKGALRRLGNDYPSLHARVVEHVERFGWLRAQGGAVAPMTSRELMQRITIALVRWTPERIAEAAEPVPAWDAASVLGGAPSEELGKAIEQLQQLTTGVSSGTQALGRAQGLAWPNLREIAARLQCEPGQLVCSTVDELQNALSGGRALPLEEMDRRRNEGFVFHVKNGDASPDIGGPPPPRPLPGQTGSMGRAVGRAKILVDADEGNRLRQGDVLVTRLSTPTYEGEPSLFPYRTVPSVAIEKVAAVVTEEGGLLSHAGIICRENSVPSIIGAEGASTALTDGQIVEIDATKGAGSIIVWSSPVPPPEPAAELSSR